MTERFCEVIDNVVVTLLLETTLVVCPDTDFEMLLTMNSNKYIKTRPKNNHNLIPYVLSFS